MTKHSATYTLRAATAADEPFLRETLYLAIYVPPGAPPPPRELLDLPSIAHYVADWGRGLGDLGFIAQEQPSGQPVGAAWLRLFPADDPGYGFVDAHTPELSIAVVPEHRGQGLGRALTLRLIDEARTQHAAVSLSVDPDNAAARLYQRLGFAVTGSAGTSLIMRADLTAGAAGPA